MAASSVDKEELLKEYFHRGYPYAAIVSLLEKRHGIRMRVRTLKRKLKELGLKRRRGDFDKNLPADKAGDARSRFTGWLSLPMGCSPTKTPRKPVPRNLVATIMKEIDPDGVKERRSRRLKRRVYVSKALICSNFV